MAGISEGDNVECEQGAKVIDSLVDVRVHDRIPIVRGANLEKRDQRLPERIHVCTGSGG